MKSLNFNISLELAIQAVNIIVKLCQPIPRINIAIRGAETLNDIEYYMDVFLTVI